MSSVRHSNSGASQSPIEVLLNEPLEMTEQQWTALRQRLVQYVRVDDGQHAYEFRCETPVELWRARTLLVKEAGTVEWIRASVAAGEVFYDIGANIGLYTLLAGKRVGSAGMVYAFEPHVLNIHSLLHNVQRNGLAGWTKVLGCALHDSEGFFDFNYFDSSAGSSMSQLNDNRDADDRQFRPALSELKYATTLDRLAESGVIRPADHVKLDVDGNELLILHGMRGLLKNRPPKSIQVEVNPRHKRELFEFLGEQGYGMASRNDTLSGKKSLEQGCDPESIGYNAVFVREARQVSIGRRTAG